MYDYLRDPKSIYEKSFSTIRAETDFTGMARDMQSIATRIIHACGMPEILPDLAYSEGVAAAAVAAIREGAPILSDCEMVTHGIIRRLLPANNDVICTLNNAEVPVNAQRLKTTRSAAAIELWIERLAGAVVVFGNAPTALFHLLELLEAGAPKPAAIFAFPVGFVGAAESKDALIRSAIGVPFITIRGRKGGSAMAAAAVNAAASLAGAAA
ncbi:precorrin-8X methylmutase [Sneathiella sp.]|uniref:precorrin-8X methylmutase n=1 Tax=Sneathiella sp. TaxID=1964365 RepID=UPI0035654FD6